MSNNKELKEFEVTDLVNILPKPLENRSGWPWDIPLQFEKGIVIDPCPKISIVTPSYNQGEFLEETIRSVLLQSYPNLEYIIMDGGSNDQSVEIIKKYEPWLTHWESKPDKGQTDAINQGMKLATGDIVAYINSDDFYQPNAFCQIAELFQAGHTWVCGSITYWFLENNLKLKWNPDPNSITNDYRYWLARKSQGSIPQPSTFWSKPFLEKYGYFRDDMHYCFDTEYWIRLLHGGEQIYFVDQDFAVMRYHNSTKTTMHPSRFLDEFEYKIFPTYSSDLTKSDLIAMDKHLREFAARNQINQALSSIIHKQYSWFIRYLLKALAITPSFALKFLFQKAFHKVVKLNHQ